MARISNRFWQEDGVNLTHGGFRRRSPELRGNSRQLMLCPFRSQLRVRGLDAARTLND